MIDAMTVKMMTAAALAVSGAARRAISGVSADKEGRDDRRTYQRDSSLSQ